MWVWLGRTLKLEKWGHLFLCPWHFVYQFSTISNKMGLWEKLSNKNFHFYCSKKWQFMFENSSWSSILLEIVKNWHTKCQGHKKRWPLFSSLRVCPCPSHTACIIQRQVVEDFLDVVYAKSLKYNASKSWHQWYIYWHRFHNFWHIWFGLWYTLKE